MLIYFIYIIQINHEQNVDVAGQKSTMRHLKKKNRNKRKKMKQHKNERERERLYKSKKKHQIKLKDESGGIISHQKQKHSSDVMVRKNGPSSPTFSPIPIQEEPVQSPSMLIQKRGPNNVDFSIGNKKHKKKKHHHSFDDESNLESNGSLSSSNEVRDGIETEEGKENSIDEMNVEIEEEIVEEPMLIYKQAMTKSHVEQMEDLITSDLFLP